MNREATQTGARNDVTRRISGTGRQHAAPPSVDHSSLRTVRRIHGAVGLATALFIVYGSWVPFQFQRLDLDAALDHLRVILDEPWRWRGSRVDWAINGLITLPLGFCALGAVLTGRRGLVSTPVAAWLVLLGSLCLSVTAELGQLWLTGRVTSLQDVAAQAIGAAGGIVGYIMAGQTFDSWAAEFVSERGPEDRARWALLAYVIGLFGYSMLPLDVVMSTRELAHKFENGQVEIIPFTYSGVTFQDRVDDFLTSAILAVPVGMWGTIAFRGPQTRPAAFGDAVFLAAGLLIAIEAVQLLIVSRYTSTTDALLGTAGAVVGIAVMRRVRERRLSGRSQAASQGCGSLKWWGASGVYAAVLVLVFWAPFDFTDDKTLVRQRWEAFRTLPLVRLHGGSDVHSLFQAIRMVARFAPLGALMALGVAGSTRSWESRRIGFILAATGVAGWAVMIELGQVLLPSRFADSSDVLVCVVGGWLGLAVTARLATWQAPAESVNRER